MTTTLNETPAEVNRLVSTAADVLDLFWRLTFEDHTQRGAMTTAVRSNLNELRQSVEKLRAIERQAETQAMAAAAIRPRAKRTGR